MAIVKEQKLYSSYAEESVFKCLGPARILVSSKSLSNNVIVSPSFVAASVSPNPGITFPPEKYEDEVKREDVSPSK